MLHKINLIKLKKKICIATHSVSQKFKKNEIIINIFENFCSEFSIK